MIPDPPAYPESHNAPAAQGYAVGLRNGEVRLYKDRVLGPIMYHPGVFCARPAADARGLYCSVSSRRDAPAAAITGLACGKFLGMEGTLGAHPNATRRCLAVRCCHLFLAAR